jgi:hypothetical protein
MCNHRQESLEIEAAGDSILGEQTWPSEAELRHADELMDAGRGRERRKVPATVRLCCRLTVQ